MLKQKVAVITGANRGIGLATVEVFANNRATIWACARSQSDEFEKKLQEIANSNSTIIKPLYFDVTDQQAMKEAFRQKVKGLIYSLIMLECLLNVCLI